MNVNTKLTCCFKHQCLVKGTAEVHFIEYEISTTDVASETEE